MEPKNKKIKTPVFIVILFFIFIIVVSWGLRSWNKSISTGIAVEDKAVLSIAKDSPAANAGIQVGDSVVAINGVPVGDAKGLIDLALTLEAGDTLIYQTKRDKQEIFYSIRLETPPKTNRRVTAIVFAVFYGLLFLLIGFLVYWKKPGDRRTVVFCWMSTVAAIFFSLERTATTGLAGILDIPFFASFALNAEYIFIRFFLFLILELLILHLTFVFPKDRPIIEHHPYFFTWIYALAALLLLATAYVQQQVLLLALWLLNLYVVLPLSICITLLDNLSKSRGEERKQIRWPLWGTLIAVVGPLVISSIIRTVKENLAGDHGVEISLALDYRFVKFLFLLIPISFAFAILKYRLMDIDLIIKKTIIYASVTGIVLTLYFALVFGLGGLLVESIGVKSQWVTIFFTLAIAAVFIPLRNRVQNVVDRRFFRKKYDYPTALKTLNREISQTIELQAMLKLVTEHLQPALQNRSVVIFSRGTYDRAYVATAKVGLPDEILGQVKFEVDSRLLTMMDSPFEVHTQDLPEVEKLTLRKTGSAFIVPVKLKNELVGFISLGTKLSDENYDDEDKDFLTSVAEQMAVGVDRIRLHEQERDFEKAREIQQGLLPKKIPQLPGYEIACAWQPARAVAGDYYDVIKLSESALGICIADVVGKGMPAALLMSNLQAIVRAMASEDMPPKQLCEKVNRLISNNLTSGKFITFFYCLLDAEKKKLVYTNAGHNRPILVHQDGSWTELKEGGPVLGLFHEHAFEQGEVHLDLGDRLLLFTDGVTEAMNTVQEEFGEERLIEVLGKNRQLGASDLQKKIMEAVAEFSGSDFQDDVTLIVISVQ